MKIKVLILFLSIIFLASCSGGQGNDTKENVASEDIEVNPSANEEKEEETQAETQTENNQVKTAGEEGQNQAASENITVQAAIASKSSDNSYKITNVYNAAKDETLGDMTLNLSAYSGDKNFEEGDVIEIEGSSSQGVLTAGTINIISKASGYDNDDLEQINQDPAPKAGDQVVINGTVLQVGSSEILLESIGGDLSEDMAKIYTSKDYTAEIQAGGFVRVSGTIQGYENESVLINATSVVPQ